MMNKKVSKKTLVISTVSLVLCLSMFIGATFAWFTDFAATGTNHIVAGNLDIELYQKVFDEDGMPVIDENNQPVYAPVDPEASIFNPDALWEPGHTEVVYLKIKNVGTLALDYTFGVDVVNEITGTNVEGVEFRLSNYLRFGYIANENETLYGTREDVWEAIDGDFPIDGFAEADQQLLPDAEKFVTVAIYMPTDVGNEANYRIPADITTMVDIDETDIDDPFADLDDGEDVTSTPIPDGIPYIEMDITVQAKQSVHEEDSFGDDYDGPTPEPGYHEPKPTPNPFAEADAEAVEEGNTIRYRDGSYSEHNGYNIIGRSDDHGGFNMITDVEATSKNTTTVKDGTHFYLNMNGHEFAAPKPLTTSVNSSTKPYDTEMVIENGTVTSTATAATGKNEHFFHINNGIRVLTLRNVTFQRRNDVAWTEGGVNNYGICVNTNIDDSLITVKNCYIDCNANFQSGLSKNTEHPAIANISRSTITGRLKFQAITANVKNCVITDLLCGASSGAQTIIKADDCTIANNACFFNSGSTNHRVEATLTNTTINGTLLTASNVVVTLIDCTVNGTFGQGKANGDQVYTSPTAGNPVSKPAAAPRGTIVIVSGRYASDPTDYLAAGSTATYDSATAMWIVTAGN